MGVLNRIDDSLGNNSKLTYLLLYTIRTGGIPKWEIYNLRYQCVIKTEQMITKRMLLSV